MTYAGLKSMIHAGLTPDDPRVKAAITSISAKNYTLDENPGLGQSGSLSTTTTPSPSAISLARTSRPSPTPQGKDSRLEAPSSTAALAKRQNARRELGEPRRPLHGGRPEPGDIVRIAGLGVC